MLIYTWNRYSEGADALKDALKAKKIKHEGSKFKGASRKTVLNWGSSELPPEVLKCRIINHANKVDRVANKLHFFSDMLADEVGKTIIPDITTSFDTAVQWCSEGHSVCARTILRGHSANGLVIMQKDNPKDFTRAPLYTKYVPKTEEYRIHVMRGEIIDVQRKTLSKEKHDECQAAGVKPNWFVRNHDNGFIFQRENVAPAQTILTAAKEALRVSGLDFGAVDVIQGKKDKRAYVLEINTAPGLQGTSVQNYADAIQKHFG